MRFAACLLTIALPLAAFAQETATEDVVPGLPFKEGDVLTFAEVDKLKDYLPPQFWEHREYFLYEGMELEIGPAKRDYETGAEAYRAATEQFRGQPRIGRDSALENYTAGQPFPTATIDCKGDPQAGAKIIWNFVKGWEGAGGRSTWSYTYWDRGDQLPLYYEGTARGVNLTHRAVPS